MTRKRWLWIAFSIFLVMLLGVLGTTHNVALVRNYRETLELARRTPLFQLSIPEPPHWSLALETSGYLLALLGVLAFMFKILKEMKLNQLQSEFLASVSHELKTPIATLELTSDLLRNDENSNCPDRNRLWQSHQEELSRLKREVEDLLEAARLQAGVRPRQLTSIHLGQWLKESFSRWHSLLGQEAHLEMEGAGLNFHVQGDPKTMDLILGNIMDNVRKFATDSPRVRIRTTLGNGKWQILIRDSGRGFPPEESRKIFSRFHRAPNGAPHAIPGSGLGLYLSETAAKSLGWKITASSEGIGKGAEFQISGRAPA